MKIKSNIGIETCWCISCWSIFNSVLLAFWFEFNLFKFHLENALEKEIKKRKELTSSRPRFHFFPQPNSPLARPTFPRGPAPSQRAPSLPLSFLSLSRGVRWSACCSSSSSSRVRTGHDQEQSDPDFFGISCQLARHAPIKIPNQSRSSLFASKSPQPSPSFVPHRFWISPTLSLPPQRGATSLLLLGAS